MLISKTVLCAHCLNSAICKMLSFFTTRCPAWCDRILMNESALKLVVDVSV